MGIILKNGKPITKTTFSKIGDKKLYKHTLGMKFTPAGEGAKSVYFLIVGYSYSSTEVTQTNIGDYFNMFNGASAVNGGVAVSSDGSSYAFCTGMSGTVLYFELVDFKNSRILNMTIGVNDTKFITDFSDNVTEVV